MDAYRWNPSVQEVLEHNGKWEKQTSLVGRLISLTILQFRVSLRYVEGVRWWFRKFQNISNSTRLFEFPSIIRELGPFDSQIDVV